MSLFGHFNFLIVTRKLLRPRCRVKNVALVAFNHVKDIPHAIL